MKESRVRKTLVQISTLAVLMFVTYYLIMRDRDFHQVMRVLEDSSKFWLIVAFLFMGVYVFCGGWCIRVLMKPLGRHVSVWRCFKYSLIEIYFSAITPSNTGGQPMQLIYMSRDGMPKADSTVVLIAVTVLYKAAFLIITALLFLLGIGYISGPISSVWFLAVLGTALNVALIVFLLILLFNRRLTDVFIKGSIRLLGKMHIVKDVPGKLAEFEEKLSNYHRCAGFFMTHKMVVLKAFGVLTLQRFALLSITLWVYFSLGVRGYTVLEILATQCLLNLCVDLMPLPGAVGISETVFLMLFTPIFTEAKITTAVLLSRGISFYVLVVVAAIAVMGIQIAGIFRRDPAAESITSSEEEEDGLL